MKLSTLLSKARSQEEEAYRILGAKPGPGIDLSIYPVEPMCGMWYCNGLTRAGKKFVFKFYMEQPFNNYILAKLKREAQDWALKYDIKLPSISLALEPKSDPL
jgi:hypothetical protein